MTHREPLIEWAGGRRPAPLPTSRQAHSPRAELVLWIDVAREQVVSSQVVYEDDPPSVVLDSLRRALDAGVGATVRRPQIVRVDDPRLAQLLDQAQLGVEVRVGPVPELDQALRKLGNDTSSAQEGSSYLSGNRIAEPIVRWFFQASSRFYSATPWKYCADDVLLALSIPSLHVHHGCVAIMGASGESFGFLLFKTVADYHRFAMVAHASDADASDATDRESDVAASVFSVSFERGSELPRSLRREIAKYRWPVADPHAYPTVMRLDPDSLGRLLIDEDYVLGAVCAEAIAAFFERHASKFNGDETPEISERIRVTAAEGVSALPAGAQSDWAVEITVPHPEALRVFEDQSDGSNGGANALHEHAILHALHEQADAMISDFIATEQQSGRDEAWCDVAGVACGALLVWKIEISDGLLQHWVPADLQTFLLDYFPGAVGGDSAALQAVPEIFQAFFAWMATQGLISARDATQLRQSIHKIRSAFLQAVRASSMTSELVQLGKPKK